jgi:GT2 family glycosyltransferase/glycosyltransferase involved in cell wall biosynthesis
MLLNDIGTLCFDRPFYLSGRSAWAEHIPFAFTLIEKVKPRIFVELGTHYGDSYCGFCQAISKTALDCQAYAVDTWQGDEHAGYYGQEVLNQLRAQHDGPYASFSRLLRETFDEAATYFGPASVDLLHIDGLHTYEAVKHDFETWLPLLSDQAVVLFHDISVRENNFGVWRLFDELAAKYPTFRFDHSHGLGVVAVGSQIPEGIRFLFNVNDQETLRLKQFYHTLGVSMLTERQLSDALHTQNNAVAIAEQTVADLQQKLSLQQIEVEKQLSAAEAVRQALSAKNQELQQMQSKVVQTQHLLEVKDAELHTVLNTRAWKAAAVIHRQVHRARRVRLLARKVLIAKERLGGWKSLSNKALAVFRQGGISALKNVARSKLQENGMTAPQATGSREQRFQIAVLDLARRFTDQAEHCADAGVKISILMPVYKVPTELLRAAIDSVRRQSYPDWELCIADDCSESAEVTKLLEGYAAQDSRIKWVALDKNSGISVASNQAAALATGDYIALLDNDDLLTNDALQSMAKAIAENPDAEMLYSDECKIDESGKVLEIFSKPDWSPSLLLNCMYTGHFSAYKRSVFESVGKFRSDFDFSQDYDLALRVSEVARNIVHIERVLYGWRAISTSGAAGGKPYARDSNIRALQSAGDRRGWKGTAVALPTANRFRFSLDTTDLVSIVIPSDNADNIRSSIDSIKAHTTWKNYEIVVVTNSGICNSLAGSVDSERVRWVRYDLPYSFSDKCNKGAEAAIGTYLVFFNDDVRVQTPDWVETLVEYLQLPNVGIVGPKLVYEDGKIQHAGMVTGVRRLLGTSFHCLPQDTSEHYNFAQSVREVSLICGACLAIRKDIFFDIEGFDAVNAPINHSDVDICFKVRERGYSCVYTPHSTLTHIGHMSLATVDAAHKVASPKKKDKADIHILRRWAHYLGRDPFYPKTMREQLFHDSPEYYEIYATQAEPIVGGKDVLIISHDLSESGAPRVVYEIAKTLTASGNFVVVAAPVDGPIREALQKIGVTVVVDELLLTQHTSVYDFSRNFDKVICNTVVTYPVVLQMADTVDTYWYIHETSLFTHLVSHNQQFREALKKPKQIWAGSKLAAGPIEAYNPNVQVMEYGFTSLVAPESQADLSPVDKLTVRTFGSYEPRKGQDLLALAIEALPESVRDRCRFEFYGRILDKPFHDGVAEIAARVPQLELFTDIDYEQYVHLVFGSDLVIVPSRDDTLPLVSLHALSAGKPLMCTQTTGTSAYVEHMESGFIIASNHPSDMSTSLSAAIAASREWKDIGHRGQGVFAHYFSENEFSKKINSMLDVD